MDFNIEFVFIILASILDISYSGNRYCSSEFIFFFHISCLYFSFIKSSDDTLNRVLFWIRMQSIWSKSNDPGTLPKVVPK